MTIKFGQNNQNSRKFFSGALASILVLSIVAGTSFSVPAYGDDSYRVVGDKVYTASGRMFTVGQNMTGAAGTTAQGSVSALADNGIMGNVRGIEATFGIARIQEYDPLTHAKISEIFVPCPVPTPPLVQSCNGRGLALDPSDGNLWYSILTGGQDLLCTGNACFTGDGLIHKISPSGGADILTIPDPYGNGGRGIGAMDMLPNGNILAISYVPAGNPLTEEVSEITPTGTVVARCEVPFDPTFISGDPVGTETLAVDGTTFLADGGEAELTHLERYSLPVTNLPATPCTQIGGSFSPTAVEIGGIDLDLAGNLVVSSTEASIISNIDGPPFSSLVGSSFATDAKLEDITIGSTGCIQRPPAEDPISMNTVRNQNTVKTIHAEKHVFDCLLDQGNLPIIVDVTIFAEIYEDISTQSVIKKQALVVTCTKDGSTVTVIECETSTPSTQPPVPLRNCIEEHITHPQEMNTANKGSVVKTIESQKEVFMCNLGASAIKKVDIVLFTEIWENLSRLPNDPITKIAFESMRCVIQVGTAEVETCQFLKVFN